MDQVFDGPFFVPGRTFAGLVKVYARIRRFSVDASAEGAIRALDRDI